MNMLNHLRISFLVALLILTVTAMFFPWPKESTSSPPRSVPVVTTKVSRHPIKEMVKFYGNTQAQQSLNITSSVTEHVAQLHFVDGQSVAQGDVLVTLVQDEEKAELKAALARHQEQKRQLQRLANLLKSNATARREYENQQAEYEALSHEIAGIEARLADRTLTAPFSGRVGLSQVSVGSLLQPGDVVTTLDDMSAIKINFSVPSQYLEQLRPGLSLSLSHPAWNGRVINTQIASLATRLDPISRALTVRSVVANANHFLRPGMLLQIEMTILERSALMVPEEAVLSHGQKQFVWRIETPAMTALQQQVEVGILQDGLLEITKGVHEGDLIVTRGLQKLHPKSHVSLISTKE